jgi:hypothetical protein
MQTIVINHVSRRNFMCRILENGVATFVQAGFPSKYTAMAAGQFLTQNVEEAIVEYITAQAA